MQYILSYNCFEYALYACTTYSFYITLPFLCFHTLINPLHLLLLSYILYPSLQALSYLPLIALRCLVSILSYRVLTHGLRHIIELKNVVLLDQSIFTTITKSAICPRTMTYTNITDN